MSVSKIPVINREVVRAILTAHADDLRTRNFKLVKATESSSGRAPKIDKNDLFVVGGRFRHHAPTEAAIRSLRENFSHLDKFLSFLPGSIVCAGGAVLSSMTRSRAADADIFFHSTTVKEAEEAVRNCVRWLCEERKGLWYGFRNQNVTTLFVLGEEVAQQLELDRISPFQRKMAIIEEGEKYQFIHRVFPNKGAVIGGFDLSACMFMYDGFEILALPLSNFALETGCIIADLSRRSPSFEMRLRKYCNKYGFGIIVPCRPIADVFRVLEDSPFTAASYHITVGGCMRVFVKNGREATFAERLFAKQESDVADYDSGEQNYRFLPTINSIMAIQGKTDLISWEGDSENALFNNPSLNYLHGEKLKEKLSIMEFQIKTRRVCDLSTLYRWIGEKRTYSKNPEADAIKESNFPDVHFVPKDAREHLRTEAMRRFTWPAFDKNEIYILCRVVEQRCERMQAILGANALTGMRVTWLDMDQNPGRQFTASFRPDPNITGWYNPKMRRPLQIGIPNDVYVQLRLLQLKVKEIIPQFGKDSMHLICQSLWELYAEEGRELLRRQCESEEPRAFNADFDGDEMPGLEYMVEANNEDEEGSEEPEYVDTVENEAE